MDPDLRNELHQHNNETSAHAQKLAVLEPNTTSRRRITASIGSPRGMRARNTPTHLQDSIHTKVEATQQIRRVGLPTEGGRFRREGSEFSPHMTLELLVLVKRGVEYQLALRKKVGTDHHETVLLPREDLLGRRLHNGRRHERAGDLLGQDGVGVRFRGECELLRRTTCHASNCGSTRSWLVRINGREFIHFATTVRNAYIECVGMTPRF